MQRPQAEALVGRNRFIAAITPPRTFSSGTSHFAERRNKAIAPYGPATGAHFVSFNFTNALICTLASSAGFGFGWLDPRARFFT
jgi:hypothetical protein